MYKSLLALHLMVALLLLGNATAQQPAQPSKTAPARSSTASSSTAHHAAAAKTPAPAPLTLKTSKDKFSYALGMNLGTNFRRQEVEVDPAILLRGMKDAMAGGKTLLTDDEARAALIEVQTELRQKQQEKLQALGEANQKEGDAFLAANKGKEGVVALPSGLQYKILTAGTGPMPTVNDTVVCNYRGTLINGKEFDSSYKRGQPMTFPVNRVIKGWTEALTLMPVGSKWQLFIPPSLAYAERGAGPDIGPNATLIFEVELLSIQSKAENKPELTTPQNNAQPQTQAPQTPTNPSMDHSQMPH